MSSINSIGGTNPLNKITSAPAAKTAPTQATSAPNRTDKLELSNVNALMAQLKTNDIRVVKVAEIKSQIAAGTYETDDKLNAAADKLLDELA